MLNEDENLKTADIIKEKIIKDNAITFYTLAKYFNLNTISETSFLYIERCFQMVVETKNFLHLDFNLIAKILSSSELNIHSEVEVFNAAISWLNRNSEERSKYSKQLLLKVRFHLLSEDAKIHIINRNPLLTKNNERGKPLKELLLNQKNF